MAMSKNLKTILKQIENMQIDELRLLNEEVVQILKMDRAERQLAAKKALKVGSEVRFNGGRRGIRNGKILKINRTTASVMDTAGLQWKVALTLLQKMDDAA